MRMSRKRRRRLAQAQAGEEPRYKRFVMQAMRMTRSRKRKMRDEAALRQTAQVASISALALLPPVTSEAAGISNVMNDIPAAFESLRNERNRIRDFHEAQRNAREAAEALTQAEKDLQTARQDKSEAEKGLADAQQNLEKAQSNLRRIAQELANAQLESSQRTREAIAAQQAAADFAPQVWAQEAAVQAAQGRRQSLQASYEALGRELGHLSDERDGLEERIRKAWESVGYAQNRLNDVMAMVNRAQAIVPEQAAKEAEWQAYDSQLEALDAEVDSAESLLDELNSQLDALQDAREAAEDAERDARERVQDLLNEQTDGEKDLKDSETYLDETEKWQAEAEKGVENAENNLRSTRMWKQQADYDLAHFGEGKGIGIGFEYYNWHGAGVNGHQLYQPLEFYSAEKKWDFSLTTGWLSSHTGLPEGDVNGWTDTTLGITYKNDHKINDVHYFFNINVPTGKDNVHQNAMMADNLAHFNSFNEGWQFTPGIEATHKYTERDSITGRLAYTLRGDYKYRRSYNSDERAALQSELGLPGLPQGAEAQEYIDPGNKFKQEIEYRHIGEDNQLSVKFTHENASYADYRSVLRYYFDYAGNIINNKDIADGTGRNYDGEDWTLQVFGNKDMDIRNSLQYYVIGNYQAADTGGTHRYYGGLGWTYKFDKTQSGYVLLNFGETHGESYNWRLNKWDSNRHMKAIVLGYDCRLNDTSELRAKLERYNISGSASDSYHGWKMSLMWNKSF
ncbi:MAG: hypothetical protein ILA30_00500 [Selenomonas sp.]|nr:hypothetical protein [Selenomonas sp.]